MRELDVLLTNYLEQQYLGSNDCQKAAFRQLLALSDPELNGYLLGKVEPPDGEIANIIARLRGRTSR